MTLSAERISLIRLRLAAAVPFDRFLAAIDNGGSDADRRERTRAFREDLVQPVLSDILVEMADRGELPPIENAEGHQIRLVTGWNALVNGNREKLDDLYRTPQEIVSEYLVETFCIMPIVRAGRVGDLKPEDPQALYSEMLQGIASGTHDDLRFGMTNSLYCGTDDDRYFPRFRDWRMQLEHIVDRHFEPIQPLSFEPINHVTVRFETSDIVVADWFRVDGFRDTFDIDDAAAPSINSAMGREYKTQQMAKLGMIHVCVGNTSPSILLKDNTVVAAYVDEDRVDSDVRTEIAPFIDAGSCVTDLWAVSMIPVERMVTAISEKTGRAADAVRDEIEAYIADHSVTRLKLEAGTYHLYFSGAHESLADVFHSPDLPIPAPIEAKFVVSDRELRLVPKPAVILDAEVLAPAP